MKIRLRGEEGGREREEERKGKKTQKSMWCGRKCGGFCVWVFCSVRWVGVVQIEKWGLLCLDRGL